MSFLFFQYQNKKKLFKFEKLKNIKFLNLNNFLSFGIKKIKSTLDSKYSPPYCVKIWWLSLNYSLSGFYQRKIGFAMFYICKTKTSHAVVMSP